MSDSSALNVRDLLALPTDDPSIKSRRGLPNGHYVGDILGHEWIKVGQKQTDCVRYSIGRVEPTPDVTEDVSDIDFNRMELRADFYITPDALSILRDAIHNVLGLQPGVSFEVRIPEMVGAKVQFRAYPESRRQQDGSYLITGYTTVDTFSFVAV